MDICHICVDTSRVALHQFCSIAMQNQSRAWVNHLTAQALCGYTIKFIFCIRRNQVSPPYSGNTRTRVVFLPVAFKIIFKVTLWNPRDVKRMDILIDLLHLIFKCGASHSGIVRNNTFWRNRYKIERKDGAWPAVSKIQVSFTAKSMTITWGKGILGKPTWKGEIQYLVHIIWCTQTSIINSSVIFLHCFFCIITASLKIFHKRVCDLLTFFQCGISVNFRKPPKWHNFNS